QLALFFPYPTPSRPDRLGRDRHGRVEADRAVGPPHVVVDRLGDADDPHPGLGDLVRRVHRAVPADAYEGLTFSASSVEQTASSPDRKSTRLNSSHVK